MKSEAEKILDRLQAKVYDKNPEGFISEVIALGGKPGFLNDKGIDLGYRYTVAQSLLIEDIRRAGKNYSFPSQAAKEKEIPDHYEALGLDKSATQEEIDKKASDLIKKYDPESPENKNLSDEEKIKLTEKRKAVEDAKTVLSNPEARKFYDEKYYPAVLERKKLAKEKAEKENPQGPIKAQNLAIQIIPSPAIQADDKKVRAAARQTQKLRADISQSFAFTPFEIEQLKSKGYLPESMNYDAINSAVQTGANFYTKGVSAENLESLIEKTPFLSEREKEYLHVSAYTVASLEETYPKDTQRIQLANQNPTISIEQIATTPATPQANQIYLASTGGNDVFQLVGKVEAVKDRAKQYVVRALETGGKKIASTASAQLAKTTLGRLALKAGVSVATKIAAGTAIPVVGYALAEVGQRVLSKVKNAVSGFSRWVFGDKDEKKSMAKLAFAGALGAALLGLGPLAGLLLLGSGILTAGGIKKSFEKLAYIIGFLILYPTVVALVTSLIVIITIPIIVTIILIIITNSAYIVPKWTPPIQPGTTNESLYMDVSKTFEPNKSFQNSDIPLTVKYTITITATLGTLSNVVFSESCHVTRDTSLPQSTCPAYGDITLNGRPQTTFPPTSPGVIDPASPVTITYTVLYKDHAQFDDSLITDIFTVTASVDIGSAGNPNIISTSESGTATVVIGNPPQECPSGWPVGGTLNQGAYTSSSHSNAEAIDVGAVTGTTVTARHSGTARAIDAWPYGKHVEIISTCEGREFFSRYAHLSVISVSGGFVQLGQKVGEVGSTGNSTGPHLHYEFRYPTGPAGFSALPPKNPPYMLIPYVNKDLPRGCVGYALCGFVNIP